MPAMNARHIGVISDTHGLVRPQALEALRGCDLILHAGDIGSQDVLDQLGQLAPVVAIRGNNDTQAWAHHLPETEVVEINDTLVYLLHNVRELDLDPAAAGFSVVIAGHSHKPAIEHRGGVLFLNPGSAGPRRFTLPISVAHLTPTGDKFSAEIVTLDI